MRFPRRTRSHAGPALRAALLAQAPGEDANVNPPQISQLRSYAASKGWRIALEIETTGLGPELGRTRSALLTDARAGGFDVLLLPRLDMLGLGLSELVELGREFQAHRIGVISIAEGFDLNTRAGQRMLRRARSLLWLGRAMAGIVRVTGLRHLLRNVETEDGMMAAAEWFGYGLQGMLRGLFFLAPLLIMAIASLAHRDTTAIDVTCLALCVAVAARPVVDWISLWARPPLLVLWLRRFHRGPRSVDRLLFLERVLMPIGKLVTLSDVDVPRSSLSRYGRPILAIGIAIFVVAMGVFAFWFPEAVGDVPQPLWMRVVNVSIMLLLAAGAWAWIRRSRRRVSERLVSNLGLGRQIDLARLENVPRRMWLARSDRFRLTGTTIVFQCDIDDDEVWRQAIRRVAPRCDLVLLDANALSPIIEWELRVCQELEMPPRYALIADAGEDGAPVIDTTTEETLARVFGDRRPPVLAYRLSRTWWGNWFGNAGLREARRALWRAANKPDAA